MANGPTVATFPPAGLSGRSLGLIVGFLAGSLAALASGGPLLGRHLGDPTGEWGRFVFWSVVVPGMVSVSLDGRWPQFARGLGMALVIVSCPLNVLILVGLLGVAAG